MISNGEYAGLIYAGILVISVIASFQNINIEPIDFESTFSWNTSNRMTTPKITTKNKSKSNVIMSTPKITFPKIEEKKPVIFPVNPYEFKPKGLRRIESNGTYNGRIIKQNLCQAKQEAGGLICFYRKCFRECPIWK